MRLYELWLHPSIPLRVLPRRAIQRSIRLSLSVYRAMRQESSGRFMISTGSGRLAGLPPVLQWRVYTLEKPVVIATTIPFLRRPISITEQTHCARPSRRCAHSRSRARTSQYLVRKRTSEDVCARQCPEPNSQTDCLLRHETATTQTFGRVLSLEGI